MIHKHRRYVLYTHHHFRLFGCSWHAQFITDSAVLRYTSRALSAALFVIFFVILGYPKENVHVSRLLVAFNFAELVVFAERNMLAM